MKIEHVRKEKALSSRRNAIDARRCRWQIDRIERLLWHFETSTFGKLGHERQLATRSQINAGPVELVVVQIGMNRRAGHNGRGDGRGHSRGTARRVHNLESFLANKQRHFDGLAGELEVVELLDGLATVVGILKLNEPEAFRALHLVACYHDRIDRSERLEYALQHLFGYVRMKCAHVEFDRACLWKISWYVRSGERQAVLFGLGEFHNDRDAEQTLTRQCDCQWNRFDLFKFDICDT